LTKKKIVQPPIKSSGKKVFTEVIRTWKRKIRKKIKTQVQLRTQGFPKGKMVMGNRNHQPRINGV